MQTAPRRRSPSGSRGLFAPISSTVLKLFGVSDHPGQHPPRSLDVMMPCGSHWPLLRDPSHYSDTLLASTLF